MADSIAQLQLPAAEQIPAGFPVGTISAPPAPGAGFSTPGSPCHVRSLGPGQLLPASCFQCPPGYRLEVTGSTSAEIKRWCVPPGATVRAETITQQVYGEPTWGAFTIGVLGGALITYTLSSVIGGR